MTGFLIVHQIFKDFFLWNLKNFDDQSDFWIFLTWLDFRQHQLDTSFSSVWYFHFDDWIIDGTSEVPVEHETLKSGWDDDDNGRWKDRPEVWNIYVKNL